MLPILLLLQLASAATLTGCGSNKASPLDPRVTELSEIHEVYVLFAKKNQKPPKQASDLVKKEYDVNYPGAVRGLRNGEYIVVWGTPVGGSSVLAYEKDAPQNGGMVVLANGNVKTMSASEVQAVVKVKG